MDIRLEDLAAGLAAEGVAVPDGALARVYRRLTQPGGCEHCGQHVKVGIYVTKTGLASNAGAGPGRTFVTACCKNPI